MYIGYSMFRVFNKLNVTRHTQVHDYGANHNC